MCGFAGFLSLSSLDRCQVVHSRLVEMNNQIAHRGPDSFGYWIDTNAGIALGHRRLAVVDLSPTGFQPMKSVDGRYVIAFNGEIYNHNEMRIKLEELPTHELINWRGHSDTETLLAAIRAWGVQGALKRCRGMFAFVLWDRQTQKLTLARDRLGEKPLYYGWQGQGNDSTFLFGSELKALKAHPAFVADIDRESLSLYMRNSYVPAPKSIYKGINKLPAGSTLSVSLKSRDDAPEAFWSASEIATRGVLSTFKASDNELVDRLDTLLRSAVKQQMMGDVPVGAFLSGGVDSSTVVALMQAQSSRSVKTFTIGFNEDSYDEAVHARAVAAHLGTDHTELYVTSQQALDIIPGLPKLYCEPFADASQIPSILVSALARQHVTVSLSGDAGDELFCGYNRYLLGQTLWPKIVHFPVAVRRMVAMGIRSFSPKTWDSLLSPLQPALPKSLRQTNIGNKLHKGAGVLASKDIDDLYLGLVSSWANPASIVLGTNDTPTLLNGNESKLTLLTGVQRMMMMDTMTYLPDDVLVKVDRAAMSVSLETRAPLLDHRVFEFAWRLPQSLKIKNGIGKWALRQVLYRYVPQALIERPKMGFGVPIDVWLRGPLREWAEELLSESRLRREGFLDPIPIRRMLADHLSGRRNFQNQLWNVLMFQTWLDAQNK
jgi:asparagine synthase (glutamine-hydrolysing)